MLGGGAIGVELAQVFRRFGSSVTVLEAGPSLIGPEEPEAGRLLAEVFAAEGIEVRTGAAVESVQYDGSRFMLATGGGDLVSAERLLVSTGRHAELGRLNVSAVGLDESARSLPVDDHLRVDGAGRTWAIGDVTGKGAFTHVSMYQADIVVNDVLGREVVPADYRALPRVTFTDPEIGSVGLSERRPGPGGSTSGWGRRRSYLDPGLDPQGGQPGVHQAGGGHRPRRAGRCHLGGAVGGEVLGLLTLAVHAGVPVDSLRHMIYAYPTFHRAVEAAVDSRTWSGSPRADGACRAGG